MDTDTAYIVQLKAILACGHSDGYLKKWATDWLGEIEYQGKLLEKLEKTPAFVS
jgi:hypothetical protein